MVCKGRAFEEGKGDYGIEERALISRMFICWAQRDGVQVRLQHTHRDQHW